MKFRVTDAALALTAIVGAIMAVSSARTLHALQQEHVRLSQTAGELVITDPAQVHVRAIATSEPLHFAWHVYAPAGHMTLAESTGNSGRSSSADYHTQPREFIARIRFTEVRNAQNAVYTTFSSGASYWTFGSPQLFQFLRDHRNELEVEQLGADEPARIKPGELATLLRLRLPEKLAAQARRELGESDVKEFVPNVFECRVKLKP